MHMKSGDRAGTLRENYPVCSFKASLLSPDSFSPCPLPSPSPIHVGPGVYTAPSYPKSSRLQNGLLYPPSAKMKSLSGQFRDPSNTVCPVVDRPVSHRIFQVEFVPWTAKSYFLCPKKLVLQISTSFSQTPLPPYFRPSSPPTGLLQQHLSEFPFSHTL